MKTVKTECPYCHAQDTLTIDAGIDITEPVKRACPACWKKKMENVNIERSSAPTCPECGNGIQDWHDFCFNGDGDTKEITCPHCEIDFVTTLSIDVTFCNKIKEIEP